MASDGQAAGDTGARAEAMGWGGGTGRVVGGRYRLGERLGHGGMGRVWRARDEVTGREVAVKEPRVADTLTHRERAAAYARIRREAAAAARIDHPAVVTIHEVVMEAGRPWIVMELVPGCSLADLLERGPITPREAAGIALPVLRALVAAHAAGVLHRDVKPGNVLLGAHGRVVLSDFGVALVEGERPVTEPGAIMGSPEYLAPERALGRRPGPASDLWSLGVLLYEAVEGVSPFRRQTTISTLRAVVGDHPGVPRAAGPLTPLIARLLSKEPEDRPGAREIEEALAAVAPPAAKEPGRARAAPGAGAAHPPPEARGRGPRPVRWMATALGTTVLVVLLVLAFVLLTDQETLGAPGGWRTYREQAVRVEVGVPRGYVRTAVGPREVAYRDPEGAVWVLVSRHPGAEMAAGEAGRYWLGWYRRGGVLDGRATLRDVRGAARERAHRGLAAAEIDISYLYAHGDDTTTRQRRLDLTVVGRDGAQYWLSVKVPAARAEEGERVFRGVLERWMVGVGGSARR
ncbi:serine/threonine-protein kinase [Streptomyces capparidis]